MEAAFHLSDEEFKLISRLVYDRFGINLGEHKRTLVVARLHKVLHGGGFSSFKEYYEHVVRDVSGHALLTLIDRISTNHTFFFREQEHFDFFKNIALSQILGTLRKSGRTDLRIWCAGCASGEEPYTLAMVLSDYFSDDFGDLDIGILATDISVTALKKATDGIYQADKLGEVPSWYRQRYFVPLKDGYLAVKQELKDMVLFRRLNLMRNEYPFKGQFHAIFCRNVMIYFDNATRQSLVERFYRYLAPDGYLIIGHSESIDRSPGYFKRVRPSVYQKT
jgi:chemotaxis protein methyltransferase CheR